MKKFLFCAAAVLALAACNKEDDVEPLTLEEAHACLEGQWISAPLTIEGKQAQEILLLRSNMATAYYYAAGWKTGELFSWKLKAKEDGNYASGTIILTYGPKYRLEAKYRKLKSGSMELCTDGETFVSLTHSPCKTAQEINDILFNQEKWQFNYSEKTIYNGAVVTRVLHLFAQFRKEEHTMELIVERGIAEYPPLMIGDIVPVTSIQIITDELLTCEGVISGTSYGDYRVYMVSPSGFYMKDFVGLDWVHMTPAN